MKYIIKNNIEDAQNRFTEIQSGATTDGKWLEEYNSYTLTIKNQITEKGAFVYISGITEYYTPEEISGATLLSDDWYLLGLRQVIKDISDCPKTGLKRKVMLRHLAIDSGQVQEDLSQPVSNQKIKGTYNIITLALDGTVYSMSQDEYITTSALSLTIYDYYYGAGIAQAVMDKFDELFD